MGTNYYAEVKECEHCGRTAKDIHIGKSSAGWCFSLHVYPKEGINTLTDWVEFLKKSKAVIVSEYGEEVTIEELLNVIKNRSWNNREGKEPPGRYSSWRDFYELNGAEPGPNNLLRHRIDGVHCIGHGPGTYDYIVGDFS